MVVWLFVMLLSGKLLANDATISRSGWPSVKGCGEESETGRGSINQEGKDTLQLVLPVPVSPPAADANSSASSDSGPKGFCPNIGLIATPWPCSLSGQPLVWG